MTQLIDSPVCEADVPDVVDEGRMRSGLSHAGEEVAGKRYYLKDANGDACEDWEGLSGRVVDYVCREEGEEFLKRMYDHISRTRFLPNSPCLVNAGSDSKSRGLLACFVTSPPEDSWIGMVDNIANFGHIARQGGGAGVDFSNIRPEGDPVFGSSHANACGPIEHMRMVSEVMSSITQSGFRGMAMMGALMCDHPDVLNFAKCKQRDRALKSMLKEDIFSHYETLKDSTSDDLNVLLDKFISNYNISVVATDEFMKAVESDGEWDLKFGGKVYETVRAKDLFDQIIGNALANGDPGMLFYDAINRGPYSLSGQVITTSNPCFHGDSLVAVADGRGFVKIRDLAEHGEDVPVYCCDPSTGEINIRYGRKPRRTREGASLCKVLFDDGGEIVTTPDHKVLLRNGEYREVGKLCLGDSVMPMTKLGDDLCDKHCVNSKVVSIEVLDDVADVYNITVDDYHNLCILSSVEDEEKTVHGRKMSLKRYRSVVYKNCGEQILPPLGSCNLGSIDVSKFVVNGNVDWKGLKVVIRDAVQFLDNVIDVNVFPTPAFESWAKDNRPVGLGVMGFADMLTMLGIAYGDAESLVFAKRLMKFFSTEAHQKSVELGKERGTPKCCGYDELEYRRNVTTLSIAPTGSIALLAGCSHSVEPFYSETIFRYDNTGEKKMGTHPDADKPFFRCAISSQDPEKQVSWENHIAMQAAFQEFCDSGISKTINMPKGATFDEVSMAYMKAWKSGCKGVTVYVDGSKTTQVLMTEERQNSRPKEVPCQIFKTVAEGREWHIIIGEVNGRPYELFAVNGSKALPASGVVVKRKRRHYALLSDDTDVVIENLSEEEGKIDPRIGLETRRFSMELRHGVPVDEIVDQIDKSKDTVSSFSKAASRIFKRHFATLILSKSDDLCPDCFKRGDEVLMEPGAACKSCPKCNYAVCG